MSLDIGALGTAEVYQSSSDVYENPNGQLDADAFMQLFLAELQNQDPTEPMETEKILDQTSMLTELETQNEMKEAFEQITETLTNNQTISDQMSAVSVIGRVAETTQTTFEVTSPGSAMQLELFFDDDKPIQSGEVSIVDTAGNVIDSFFLNDQAGSTGTIVFEWNGRDSSGDSVPAGEYSAVANYTSTDGAEHQTQTGRGRVESVIFEDGVAHIRIGSLQIPIDKATEFY